MIQEPSTSQAFASIASTRMSENFNLKWNEFHQNIAKSFVELRESFDFSDVTLVSEDNTQFKAHRIILSASSKFFQNVLLKNFHQNPMIYMRGLKTEDLKTVLDFVYHGQTEVPYEQLDKFLVLSDELQLNGLIRNKTNDNVPTHTEPLSEEIEAEDIPENVETPFEENQLIQKHIKAKKAKKNKYEPAINMVKEEEVSGPEPVENSFTGEESSSIVLSATNIENLDDQINAMMVKNEDGKGWSCSLCGKTVRDKGNLATHIEANHIEGATHTCDMCGKISRSRNALRKHIYTYHKL